MTFAQSALRYLRLASTNQRDCPKPHFAGAVCLSFSETSGPILGQTRVMEDNDACVFILPVGSALAVAVATAQVGGSGTIQGTVTDPSGAAVGRRHSHGHQRGNGSPNRRKTTDAGFFVLPLLSPASITLRSRRPVLKLSPRTHVVVDALATVAVESQVADRRGQPIDHRGRPRRPPLKTDDVALGSSMDNRVYDSLPLAMNAGGSPRDPSAFAGLASGRGQLQHAGGRSIHRFLQRRPDLSERGVHRRSAVDQRRDRRRHPQPGVRGFGGGRGAVSGGDGRRQGHVRRAGRGELRFEVGNQPVPWRRFRILPEHRFRRPGLLLRGSAGRPPERIRRHVSGPITQEQALLLRQLRWIPFRFGHYSRATRAYRLPPSGRGISAPFPPAAPTE